ncbi:hypothetical protein F1654_05015 [Alkalicaulis satelles]|uniref:HNH endonuclease n=1 Tax=Alkalicaulis satelles TaxID=2609175 RepID=A0A5M6ZKH5_9PROT|nr:hypothetical protein [Alkalicaulis satelles]KAA5805342.1 hypothetical protein F1654_05015 [Alkalicaulis satelles]
MPGMMTPAEKRLERAYRRLGTRNPVCVMCGETNPHVIELHHIAGTLLNDTVPICRNCHRKVSDPQKDRHGLETFDSDQTRIGHYLCGLADVLAAVAVTLKAFGERLLGLRPDRDDGEAS